MKTKTGSTKRKRAPRRIAREYAFPVIIEKDGDGFFALCPSLQGCYTQGADYDEVMKNIQEAVQLHVESRLAHGEPVPRHEIYRLTTVSVHAR